jgi:hypothetical protein
VLKIPTVDMPAFAQLFTQFYEGSGHGSQYQESQEEAKAYANQEALERKAKADTLALTPIPYGRRSPRGAS